MQIFKKRRLIYHCTMENGLLSVEEQKYSTFRQFDIYQPTNPFSLRCPFEKFEDYIRLEELTSKLTNNGQDSSLIRLDKKGNYDIAVINMDTPTIMRLKIVDRRYMVLFPEFRYRTEFNLELTGFNRDSDRVKSAMDDISDKIKSLYQETPVKSTSLGTVLHNDRTRSPLKTRETAFTPSNKPFLI
jgi:hypothetical protein